MDLKEEAVFRFQIRFDYSSPTSDPDSVALNSTKILIFRGPVLRIRDISVRIRGSIPLITDTDSDPALDTAIFVSDLEDGN